MPPGVEARGPTAQAFHHSDPRASPMRRPLALLLAATILPACGSSPAPSDASEPLRVGAGERFEVVLRANHSTGFEWALADSAGLGPIRLEGRRYEVPRALRRRDGAGGTETWTFRALAPGEGAIALVYRRPWGDHLTADSTRFRVLIR